MSSQSIAKEIQGYTRTPKNCGNCLHFSCDIVRNDLTVTEKNLLCTLGGFKVNKTAICNKHIGIGK
jgi:hypothetical protein